MPWSCRDQSWAHTTPDARGVLSLPFHCDLELTLPWPCDLAVALFSCHNLALSLSCPYRDLTVTLCPLGEDRWLCTLLLQQGYHVDYCAAADAFTNAPTTFPEFFKQRRRWTPSTMANILDLLLSWRQTRQVNDYVTLAYILYQVNWLWIDASATARAHVCIGKRWIISYERLRKSLRLYKLVWPCTSG